MSKKMFNKIILDPPKKKTIKIKKKKKIYLRDFVSCVIWSQGSFAQTIYF